MKSMTTALRRPFIHEWEPDCEVNGLCKDEGCCHHGTPHVCVNDAYYLCRVCGCSEHSRWHMTIRERLFRLFWGYAKVCWPIIREQDVA